MAPALSEGFQASVGMEEAGNGPGSGPGGGFLKDSQEMERILGEVDLLRVMEEAVETFGGELLPEEEIPASGSNSALDRVLTAQARLERRCQFLTRRLRMQQARNMGKHAAEETRAVVSKACGGRLPGPLQRLNNIEWKAPVGLSTSSAALRSQVTLVSHELDSDATLSSSGAETDDEVVVYNNPIQQPLPLRKRALWKWSHERARIGSRWTWLQAQIQELEHRIRQHSEFLRRTRSLKGPPVCMTPPSGYSDPLPGDKDEDETDEVCARIRPLDRATFRKRRLLQMHNLHTAAEKAAKPSDVRCICQWPLSGCAVCTGRTLPTHPLPPNSTLSKREKVALVDPAFHSVLSDIKDLSSSIHYSALMKDPQWQQKSSRTSLKSMKSLSAKVAQPSAPASSTMNATPVNNKTLPYQMSSHSMGVNNGINNNTLVVNNNSGCIPMGKFGNFRSKKNKRIRRRNPSVVRRRTSLETPDDLASGGSSPVPSPSDHYRYRIRERERTRLNSSYDIDNIVIPHSIAANTKLEILQYKEILTPKWRVVEEEKTPNNNGIIRKRSGSVLDERESDFEDLSEAGVLARHDRHEALERGKYLKKRKNSRRQNSRTTPTQTPPHTPMNLDETSVSSETGMGSSSAPAPITTNGIVSAPVSGANGLIQQHTPAIVSSDSSSIPVSTSNCISGISTTSCSVALVPLSINPDAPSLPVNSITTKRRATEDSIEVVVSPYSPRTFPLNEEVYTKMLRAMPENHPLSTAESSSRSRGDSHRASDSETSSMYKTYTPMNLELPSDSDESRSPEEDPTDPEWNVTTERDEKNHR